MPTKVAQVPVSVSISTERGKTTKRQLLTYKKAREMRRHPTIFISRLIVRAAILSGAWTVQGKEGYDDLMIRVADWVFHLREDFLEYASAGCLDYGWQAFEKKMVIEDGLVKCLKLKPLLQDLTTVRLDDTTGDFIGVCQDDGVELTPFSSMNVNINAECSDPYGESYLGNVVAAYDRADRVNSSSDVYDKKIAGAHWVIQFPEGSSLYNGVETPNDEICNSLIKSLQNSGSFGIPKRVKSALIALNEQSDNRWVIELKEASGSGANFDARLTRCDKEIVRGFGLPERAILEGQYGTKAEAGEHGDLGLVGIELLHKRLVSQFNKQLVNQLLLLNEGRAYINKVYVVVQSLSDDKRAYLQTLYNKILESPDGSLNEISTLDVAAIRDRLDIPYIKPDDGSH